MSSSRSPIVTARLWEWQIGDGTDAALGDVIEISFTEFSGDLQDVGPDDVLEVEDIRVIPVQPITGIRGRSYRARVIDVRLDEPKTKTLRLMEVPRDRTSVDALPM